MKRLLNSILIEGICTDDARLDCNVVQFNLEHPRDGRTLNYKIDVPIKLMDLCKKGKMIRVVGRLDQDSIIAEHIEVKP